MTVRISLTKPQFEFVTAEEQFPAMVAGYGAGKTHAAIARIIALKLKYPKQNVAYYLPSYPLIGDIAFPRISEMLSEVRVPFTLNKNDKAFTLGPFGSIICRTMDTPDRIVGFEVADSIVDELDTLPMEKAREVWNRIISRNRQKKPDGSLNTVAVATTPEGFRFTYERWQKNPAPGYRIIKASTYSNAKNLPDGYIDSLKASYSSALLAAYLDGEFVNLTAGSVYPEFDRKRHGTNARMQPSEPLHIGMDFNVTKMAAVVFVMRNGKPVAVAEHVDVYDTPAMIGLLKAHYGGRSILVYPDSSGGGRRSTNASVSDIALLKGAGFRVCAHPTNPAVKDRVASVNKLLRDGDLRVNVDTCPALTEALEQQTYDKNGEPDKTTGHDHVLDAAGYFCAYKFPIERPKAVRAGNWVEGMV